MGTGTVAILAGRFHFGQGTLTLEIISAAFFFLNLALWVVFIGALTARFVMFPALVKKVVFDTRESLFFGAFPIGSATLIDSGLLFHRYYGFSGKGFMFAMWALWWVDLLLAYVSAFGLIYIMMYTRNHFIRETTSLWALPILPLIVASSTGGTLSQVLVDVHHITLATVTAAFSLVALSIGMSLALMIITLYFVRLLLDGPPLPEIVISGFIIASPFGTSGSSLLTNGRTLVDIFPDTYDTGGPGLDGRVLYNACFAVAFVFWSMGASWVLISIFSICVVRKSNRIPFTITYWGAVFPNGVYALCTVQLGIAMNSTTFHYLGVVWSGITLLLWVVAAIPTVKGTLDTTIFPDCTPV